MSHVYHSLSNPLNLYYQHKALQEIYMYAQAGSNRSHESIRTVPFARVASPDIITIRGLLLAKRNAFGFRTFSIAFYPMTDFLFKSSGS